MYARDTAEAVEGAELFVYPGSQHCFAEHDLDAGALLRARMIDFLAAI